MESQREPLYEKEKGIESTEKYKIAKKVCKKIFCHRVSAFSSHACVLGDSLQCVSRFVVYQTFVGWKRRSGFQGKAHFKVSVHFCLKSHDVE